ncbi:MAG: Trp biosynthesis-associated membrane protein [Microbacterium sp.]|uniref:Trp biosynthesis-associated membrane protein n=1 Tax=Microbacterium sp. TaxID=51671 RepID=UPI003A8B631C
MIRRARLICILAVLLAGALGVISSTQTWLVVTLAAGGDALTVPGADALPVLAPLSLAVLALGAALSLAGRVLRYVLGALTVAAAVTLLWLTVPIAVQLPVSAVASTVTTHTGIAGVESVSQLVATITATAWPAIAVVLWVVLLLAGTATLATAHGWRRTGRRFSASGEHAAAAADTPLDAVDSWDDLSRGDDPTR